MQILPFIPATLVAVVIFGGCSSGDSTRPTSEFAITGLAEVRGRILDVSGAPKESFRIGGGVNSGSAMYLVASNVHSSADGSFVLRVERRGAGAPSAPDSVELVMSATATRLVDRYDDGLPMSASARVWVRFAQPPAVASVEQDIVVLLQR